MENSKETLYCFEFTRGEINLLVNCLETCAEGWAGGFEAGACEALIAKLKEAR